MTTYFVTYGSGHKDAQGRHLLNSYSVLEATDELDAHRKIAAIRAGKWAFLYHSAEAAGVEHYGLQLVELGPHAEDPPAPSARGTLEDNEPPL